MRASAKTIGLSETEAFIPDKSFAWLPDFVD